MAENENAVASVSEQQPEAEVTAVGTERPTFGARVKEWFRKFLVSLKRKTHVIAFVMLLVSSVVYLCGLNQLSQAIYGADVEFTGLPMFVNTLFSILVLLLYLWSFPKRKKVNVVMLVLVFVFIAVMIVLDVVFYVNYGNYIQTELIDKGQVVASYFTKSRSLCITHIVLLGITVLLIATMPLYKKLFMMINTRKDIGESQLNDTIESEDE